MSSRRNFLDADNSIMEKNLRFVKNDLEDNLNQYFGGSGGSRGNNSTISVPPRDYKVVQPKPGGSHASKPAHDLEERRKFLLQIGLARHEAYELAKRTNFSVNYYMEKRHKWLKNGLGEKNEIDNRLICEIKSGDYKCDNNNSGNGAGHQDRSNRRANDRDQDRFNMSPNDEYDYDRMIETPPPPPPQIPGYQIEREHRQNYDQSYRSRSPSKGVQSDRNLDDFQSPRSRSRSRDFNCLQQEGGCDRNSVQYSQSSRPRSPFRGFQSMQQERESDRNLDDFQSSKSLSSSRGSNSMLQEKGYNRNFNSLQYSQLCRPHSPSRGFNSIPDEVGSTRNVDDFQSTQFNSIDEREYSKNINSSLKNMMGSKPSSTTNYDSYMFNNNSYFGNQYPSSNVTPLVGKNSSSYRSNTHNQSMHNIKPLMGFDIPSQDKSRNTKNIAPLFDDDMKNKNVPLLLSGNVSYIPESQMSLSTNSYFGNQYPSSNVPPLARQNSSSYRSNTHNQSMHNIKPLMGVDNPSQDKSRNSKNVAPLIEDNVKNKNVPSLLSLPLVQNPIPFSTAFWKKLPSNSEQRTLQELIKLGNTERKKEQQNLKKKLKRERQTERRQQIRLDPYKKPMSNIPIIPIGFKKPSPGLSKANPKEYWTQWWPRYKYVEMSIPKVNPQDEVVRKAINFLLKPQDPAFCTRKNLLLRLGVSKIKRNVNITESNYSYRDTFKLFKYKKHLEDPNFQNELAPSELNNVKSTLALLNKRIWALLLQSLICKWHHSLDTIKRAEAGELVKTKMAQNLLQDKVFNYLVMECIQQLKDLCKDDWPNFEAFYNSIDATKDVTDITKYGLYMDEEKCDNDEADDDD